MERITLEDRVSVRTADETPFLVIWLHGLGADGNDFVPIISELSVHTQGIHFVFPHAPHRAVTLNNGIHMRAWYDISSLDRNAKQDREGILESSTWVLDQIESYHQQGYAYSNIVLAGFSQGGAIALHAGLNCPEPLAGVIALSTYLPISEDFTAVNETHKSLPIFMAHGTQDDILPLQFGDISQSLLKNLGYDIDWKTYDMSHMVCKQEIDDINQFLKSVFKR